MKRVMLIGILLLIPLIHTGCWDRKEINDIGLVMATAIDLAEDGQMQATLQVAVPSPSSQTSGASKETERFFLISDVGKNGIEIEQKLQQKMSRTLFFSHRSVILVGEALARKGLDDILDTFTRNPRNRLKAYILVVKGKKAGDLLQVEYPYELAPSEALKEMEMLQGKGTVATLRDYMIASASEGMSPTTGVLEPTVFRSSGKKDEKPLFRITGTAIFKSSKLVGFLNNTETHEFLWFKGNKKGDGIAAGLPDGMGNAAFSVTSSKTKIKTDWNSNPLKFHIDLTAKGDLVENDSKLDVSNSNNLRTVKKALEKQVVLNMEAFLRKIQTEYHADIVGFSQQLQRDNPKKWRTVEKEWDRYFTEADISVTVNLAINNTGEIGPPLQFKDKEIMK
ncbi:spore germination protein KC [Paenibacillus sophorae]|uniref:Ger(X)C family spore germination protein n=1 Tax=Paenibacillus sophorae TaxID=1333845 RepID=A0A1H8RVH5_9BACL|nr:Ger(x)C family spore germination protein [Paenibacillus sophorae]SEO70148.1 spore germination protein KC [Paenibacillus sophorae]